jgi:spore coat protein U-like protein
MKQSNRTLSLAITASVGILTLGLASTAANATTATNTFNVTASVVSSCLVSAPALSFGTYNSTQIDATTTLTVTCTNNTTYNVGLDKGLNGGSVSTRQMKSGSYTLNYSLFSDSGRTVNWGNTAGTDTVPGTGNGSAQNITVYGRLPGAQVLNIGSYTDTITATVTY